MMSGEACTMAMRNRLLGKTKSEPTNSASNMRLQRYIDVDCERRAKEKLTKMELMSSMKALSAMKALKAAAQPGVTDLKDANAKAAQIVNGTTNDTTNGAANSNGTDPDWRTEAKRRLDAAEKTWPHKLGANLKKWRK